MPSTSAKALAGLGGYVALRALRRQRAYRLRGRVALVMGGSRGLGLLLARELAAQGCKVALCARDGRELKQARADLAARGATVWAQTCDASDRGQVEALVHATQSELGPVDVLVNNASIIQVGPLETMTLADFTQAMTNTFWSALHATLAVLPSMRARREGRIVNITSIGGKVAVPHLLPYDCAKFALVGLSEGLRAELAQDGIKVTTVVPGLMRTGSPANAFFKGQQELEFSWFTLCASLPLSSMDARRAARRIVQAAIDGRAEVTLSWQAKLIRLAHALLPGLTSDLLGALNRALPRAAIGTGGLARARGMDLATGVAPSRLTAMASRAARELNQYGGVPRPSPIHAEQAGLPTH